MNISVAGLGMVSKIGRFEDLEQLLTSNRSIDLAGLLTTHNISLDMTIDFNIPQQLIRRMSRFAKISLFSACDAIQDSGLDIQGKTVGIIQGSVYGPIISGIQAFDDLIDFGDNQLSPTNFSGSVFNTAATYLSLTFGIQGPTLTHTSGLDTLYNSLQTAALWLENGSADYVIVGIGDEYTPFFDRHCLTVQQPTALLPTCEGWTTLMVCKAEEAKYGKIALIQLTAWPETKHQKAIYSVWHEQMVTPELLNRTKDNQSCFPVHMRGSYPSGSAFDLALALLCKKTGQFPVYHRSSGNYQTQNVNQDERICCYSPSENNGLFCYELSL